MERLVHQNKFERKLRFRNSEDRMENFFLVSGRTKVECEVGLCKLFEKYLKKKLRIEL